MGNNIATQSSFSVDFIYIILVGSIIASGVLFLIKKIKMNNQNKNRNM